MPAPSSSLATLRPELGGSMEEFSLAMDREGFIGHRILPVFEAGKKSGTFGKIPVEQLLQNRETRRAPGAGYSRGTWKFEPTSFACEEHGAEEPVDDLESEMYREYFIAEQVSAARALDAVIRNAEKRAAALVFNPTTWTSHTTGVTNEWDDASNATPIADVEAAVQACWEASGLWPNALIINRLVFRNLRNVDEIIDRLKYQGFQDVRPSKITEAALAQVFDLEEVIVAGSAKNSANEGQVASIAPIWSNEYAMIARVCRTNDIKEPGLGRTIHWSADGSEVGGHMETYRDETVRSDVVRCRHDVDEIILHVQSSHLLSNITT